MRDTRPDADAIALQAIRSRPPVERLRGALALSETVRALALAGLRRRFPDESTLQLVERITGISSRPGMRSGPDTSR